MVNDCFNPSMVDICISMMAVKSYLCTYCSKGILVEVPLNLAK